MTRTLWNELGPKWPKGYWDDWMYTFSQVLYTEPKKKRTEPKKKGYWDDWMYTFSQVLKILGH